MWPAHSVEAARATQHRELRPLDPPTRPEKRSRVQAHRRLSRFEIDQQVHQMARAKLAVSVHHGAAGGYVFESVLSHPIAPLKEHRASIEIHPVTRPSFPMCPVVPHRAFRVPGPEAKI